MHKYKHCGGLNRKGPYKLIDLNAWSPGSGTIRRCDFVGVGLALVEEVCHCGVGFEVSNAQPRRSGSLSFLCGLSAPSPGPCLPPYFLS